METLEIKKENALAAHDSADNKGKKLLEKLFGEKVFSRDIKDRVKTFNDALSMDTVIDPSALNILAYGGDNPDILALKNFFKAIIVTRVLNEGWEPDWSDSSQYKYYPWFKVNATKDKPLGVGLSCDGYGFTASYSAVGSRLCFKSADLAKYAGEQFCDIYAQFMLIQK